MSSIKDIQGIEKLQRKLEAKKQALLEQALSSNDPQMLVKANTELMSRQSQNAGGQGEQKSYLVDPWDFRNSLEFKSKKNRVSYNLLANMAKEPIINSVIRTRINQVSSFSSPQPDKYSIGFEIRKKKRVGANEELTKQEEKEIEQISEFFLNCGAEYDWSSENFDSFLRKITRDTLTYDQMTFEVVRDRKGQPTRFFATDASTFRIADSIDDYDYESNYDQYGSKRKKVKGYYPSYVQVYQSQVVNEFWPWELCFGVRNPVSDIRNYGYGFGELEELVTIVTSLLHGQQYNSNFFKQGSHPKGMFKVQGSVSPSKLQSFKQQWHSTMRGVYNAWRTPFLEADKIEWIDLQKSNKDMEFASWLEFLIKISTAVFTIDPAEINFPLQGGQGNQSLFEGSNEQRLKHSRDKGLRPLLKFIEGHLNRLITKTMFDGKYEFKFVGLNADDPETELKRDIDLVSNIETLNEVRVRRGMEEIENGDIVLNPNFMQNKANSMFAEGGMEEFEEETEEQGNPFERAFSSYLDKI